MHRAYFLRWIAVHAAYKHQQEQELLGLHFWAQSTLSSVCVVVVLVYTVHSLVYHRALAGP